MLAVDYPRLNVRANSFSNRVVDTWNNLPEDVVNAPSVNAFKSRLNTGTQPNLRQPVTNLTNHLEEFVHSIDKHHYKSDDLLRC